MQVNKSATAPEVPVELPSAADIRRITEVKEQQGDTDKIKQRQAKATEQKHQKELFLARNLTPDFVAQVMNRVRAAAEGGATEIMLGQFPSAWCSDGGRRINNQPDDAWPDTLQGFARQFFEFWERELKPRGFHLRTEIVSFPDGMPGDVGAFLSWGEQAGPAKT